MQTLQFNVFAEVDKMRVKNGVFDGNQVLSLAMYVYTNAAAIAPITGPIT